VRVPDDDWGPKRWLRIRLLCLAFLGFLGYPVAGLLAGHRPAAVVAVGLAGLAAWAACYARLTWVTTVRRHQLATPYSLGVVLLGGAALVPLLGPAWLGALAFFANAALLLELPLRYWFWALGAVAAGYVAAALALGGPAGGVLDAVILISLVGGLQAAFFRQIQDTVALRRARADLARLAVAEERVRIARDLHDVLGQELTAMGLKAQLAARLVRLDPDRAEAESAEVARVARQALDGMRATVSGYRDTSLASEVRTASALLGALGVATVVGEVPAGLPAPVDEAAAWVVREAATNVVRHAKANRCRIALDHEPGRLVVEVRDDGVAAGYRTPPTHGSGLSGLVERVEALGGVLHAGPVDGWFAVRASIPAGGGA
jgi:two-component system, NarL family, sensor histidine kinase DesK